MLRVGLTGNLGCGKSTVAAMFAARGAHLLASDAIGRELMQPGEDVFDRIVERFGAGVLAPDGSLSRASLARIAFVDGRVEELNEIVHPVVIARQAQIETKLFAQSPDAVSIVESALIFETRFNPAGEEADARARFDHTILVVASEATKIARFVRRQHPGADPTDAERKVLEAEARRRLVFQMPDEVKRARCDYILSNNGSLQELEAQVETLWPVLAAEARQGT